VKDTAAGKWTMANTIGVANVMQVYNLTEADMCVLANKGYVRLRRIEATLRIPIADLENIPPWRVEPTDQGGPFMPTKPLRPS